MTPSEPNATEQRLDTLLLRVQSLEASNKQLGWIRAALGGLLLLNVFMIWWIALKVRTELDVNSISARRIVLCDADGVVQGAWEQNNDMVRFALTDKKGNMRLGMAVNKDGPVLTFADDALRKRLALDVYKDAASMHVYDGKGTERCNVGFDEPGPGVRIMNESGKVQAGLIQTKDEGALIITDDAGNPVLLLAVGKKQGTIILQDLKGTTRLEIGLKGDKPGIKILDEAGKTIFEQP